jgi:WW domain binding protein 11
LLLARYRERRRQKEGRRKSVRKSKRKRVEMKTTKGGKVMNPTDAYRKELRKKELKRVIFIYKLMLIFFSV